MRLLWIGKAAGPAAAGDEIYDRRIIDALEAAGAELVRFTPQRVSRAAEAWNLLRGLPYYRARYASAHNLRRLRAISALHQMAICSWEPFDHLAAAAACPVLPILHNVTSQALPALLPGSRLAGALARRAGQWERRAYAGRIFPAIAVLSRADAAYVAGLRGGHGVLYAPPGCPTLLPLAPGAGFRPVLLLAGTYDWAPKHRDLAAFARAFAPFADGFKVLCEAPLPAAAAPLRARIAAPGAWGADIGIGIISDRFAAGHKLKATAYIAANAVVASFADIAAEFAGLPDAGFFIRKVSTAADIVALAAELRAHDPAGLRQRLLAFQVACAARFSWAGSARVLLDAATALARP